MNLSTRIMIGVINCAVAAGLLSSCGRIARQKKLELYTEISTTNDSLTKMTREWHQMLDRAVGDKQFGTLPPYRLKMGQFMNRHRSNIANIRTNEDNASILDSETNFLAARAMIISDMYPRFEAFNDMTPAENINGELRAMGDDVDSEDVGYMAMKKSLRAYAARR
jgi:hypothetical protein